MFLLKTTSQKMKGDMQMERQTLTVKEVANYLGVHEDTIYQMVKHQEIPHLKLRNRILFTQEAIDSWIKDQEKTNEQRGWE